jgi:ribosome maturation factor RimP
VTLEEKVEHLIKPVIESMSIDFWGCEYLPAGKNSMLRVYIDSDNGVNVDDCGKVSHQISAIMDVEDPIASAYTLEVSSPGLDRPLFRFEQFKKYQGEQVQIKTISLVMGRKRFKGIMESVNEQGVDVEVDGELYNIIFAEIDKANLIHNI